MTHLMPQELVRWRDSGEESERARVLGHLAACDACRRSYAGLVREARPAVTVADGNDAAGAEADPPAAGRSATRRMWWAVAALAAVALAGWAVFAARQGRRPAHDDTVGGDEIQIVAPAGTVTGPVAFRWSSPVRAARYRVWLHDESGAVVYSTLTAEETAHPPAEVSGRLRAQASYSWQVEAYDATGQLLGRSPEQQFTLAR